MLTRVYQLVHNLTDGAGRAKVPDANTSDGVSPPNLEGTDGVGYDPPYWEVKTQKLSVDPAVMNKMLG